MNTDAKRFYALLGLDPRCSDEDVRSAFRRRAKELHPDAGTGDATGFIRLKRAYDTLSDPAKRAHYDRLSTPRPRRSTRATVATPVPLRARPPRPGGMSIRRYVVAFLFMGGLSFGAIETMISYADVPPTASPHPLSLLTGAKEAAGDDVRSETKSVAGSGFWDPSSRDGTPREATADVASRTRSSGIGALSSE